MPTQSGLTSRRAAWVDFMFAVNLVLPKVRQYLPTRNPSQAKQLEFDLD